MAKHFALLSSDGNRQECLCSGPREVPRWCRGLSAFCEDRRRSRSRCVAPSRSEVDVAECTWASREDRSAHDPPRMRRANLPARNQEVRIIGWLVLVKHYYEKMVNRSNGREITFGRDCLPVKATLETATPRPRYHTPEPGPPHPTTPQRGAAMFAVRFRCRKNIATTSADRGKEREILRHRASE